jgi:two-component system phosphate regulon response regulator PhoB
MSKLVLVVEDEPDLRYTVVCNLVKEGYRTLEASSGEEGLEYLEGTTLPDLILLDIRLPGLSGKDVCRIAKSNPRTREIPVVFMSAEAEEIDRIVGFELGADDFIGKPFSIRELMLRTRAILQRFGAIKGKQGTVGELAHGNIRIDPLARRAWVLGNELQLTRLEFELLFILLKDVGHVRSREALGEVLWGGSDFNPRTVDTHVKRLRAKLGSDGDYIQTVRGVGYRLQDKGTST